MATDIIARGMAANAKKSVTELGNKIESEKWIGTKAEWEAVDKSTIKDETIVYITDDETVILYDKAEMEKIAAQVATDSKAAETAAQTAQSIAGSLPDDYTTAVAKIAENTAEIANVKLADKELQRRVNALYDMGNGVTHKFETDTDTAYAKTVPTGAKLMSVKSIGGRNLVFNQIVNPNNFRPSYTVNGVTITRVDGYKFVANGTATGGDAYFSDSFVPIKGHVYLEKSCPKGGSAETYRSYITGSNVVMDTNYGSGVIAPINVDTRVYIVPLMVKSGVTVNNLVVYPQIFDLTLMFGAGNEPKTVAEFKTLFSDDYYPYNTGEIISAGTEEIVEQGANLYYGTDMLKVGSDTYEYIANSYRCKAIKLKPDTTYTLSFTSDKTSEITLLMNVNAIVNSGQYFDFRKTTHTRSYRTGDDGCLYVGVYAGNGNVASADVVKRLSECKIMISESDTPITYAPYHRNEYHIPEAIRNLPGYGWSAGTARNYVDYENKKYVQCVNSVDLGTKNWRMYKDGDYTPFFYLNAVSDIRGGTSNFLCPKYQYVKIGVTDSASGLYVLENTTVRVRDTAYTDAATFKQAMQGVILYYELANPIITDISTLIPDDFLRNIEVEAGGSVTFKNSNDSYRIPVPSEDEYIVKLSEVGGTT